MKKCILWILLLLQFMEVESQNIGINNPAPSSSALLDLTSTDKGLLIPRVALLGTNFDAPVGAGVVTSLLVFNTATSGAVPNNVIPGYYYWNGTRWVRLLAGGGVASEAWQTSGNSGMIDITNFLGTTDNVPLNFRVNNQRAGRIDNFRRNVTWGYVAGNSLINGFDNVFVGDSTGYNNTNGFHNIFIGKGAGFSNIDGQDNIFMGWRAGYNNFGNYNMFFGQLAGFSNTSGGNNAFFGVNAGMDNVDGDYNSFFGTTSGSDNISGDYNSFFGSSSGYKNTSGNHNSFYGYNTGYNNTSGSQNTFIGKQAGRLNQTGNSNTFVGDSAGYKNVYGSYNTTIGYRSELNQNNFVNASAIGAYSRVDANSALVLGSVAGINGATNTVYVGIGTTNPQDRLHVVGNIRMVDGNQASGKILRCDALGTGYWQNVNATDVSAWGLTGNSGTVDAVNFLGTTDGVPLNFRVNNQRAGKIGVTGQVFLGYQAGNAGSTPSSTAIGYQALYSSTAGINTAFGHLSMYTTNGGSQNTALGYMSLYNLTSGNSNTAAGHLVLYSNQGGYGNTALGYQALYGNVSGYRNTAIGYSAGNYGTAITTGDYNTLIGNNAASDDANRINCIALAGNSNLAFDGDNRVRIGNGSMTSIGGQVSWSTLSDERVKTEIQSDVKGLEFIMKLKPVTYHYNVEQIDRVQGITDTTYVDGKFDIEKIRFSGFLSQEVEKAAQACNYPFSGVDKPADAIGLWGIRYAEFTVPLVKSVQELNDKDESLSNDIKELHQAVNNLLMEIQLLKEVNRSLENRMSTIENTIEKD